MPDLFRTKKRLLLELKQLRERIAELEKSEAEHRQAEEKARESESNFRAIAIYSYNWECWVDQNGKLAWINPAVFQLTGYTVDECMAMTDFPLALVDEEDRAKMAGYFAEADRGSSGNDVEFHLRCKDGSLKWATVSWQSMYDVNGLYMGHRSSVRDITERKRMEEALREARDYTENLIKSANVLIVGLDIDGKITLLNEIGEKITGYRADEVIGKNWFELIVPKELYTCVWDEFNKIKNMSKIIDTFENPIKTKSGEECLISWKNSVLMQGGKCVGTVSFGMDITEHKQAEAEREKLILELHEALNKVKTLSGLLPICSSCKKIRNDKGYWEQMEVYIRNHSEADFSHGICPECAQKLYPEYYNKEAEQVQGVKYRLPRKSISAPASLNINNKTFAGVVLNISLGGLLISISGDSQLEIKEGKETLAVSIVFTLPEIKNTLSVRCVPKHIVHTYRHTKVGVSFTDKDFADYQAIQNYLIN